MAKVNIDKLSTAVINELEAYKDVTVDIMTEAVKKTAKETAKEINRRAAEQFGGTGEYSKSWSYKRDPNMRGKYKFSMVVFSKPPYYRLAHLLEKGHAKVNGGRVSGKAHISPAEELAKENLVKYIKEGIEKK